MTSYYQQLIKKCLWRSLVLAALFTTTYVTSFEIPLPGGGRVKLESGGVVRIRLGEEPDLPRVPPVGTLPEKSTLSSILVRDTGTIKGYGAFCSKPLQQDTFLGFYEGRRVESREELERTSKSMDYVMSIDGGYTFLDGFECALNRDLFSPAHLNHENKGLDGCNCVRVLSEGRVAFFTSRNILEGQELCFDYGDNYWRGREDEKL
jgi:hypothetical protein